MQPSFNAAELAERFGLELRDDPSVRVSGVGTLAGAHPGQLAFLAKSKYRSQLPQSRASVGVMRADDAGEFTGTALIARDPYAAFARAASLFEPIASYPAGVHASADVAADGVVDPSAHVGAFVSIGARSRIGPGAFIGPGCVIGEVYTHYMYEKIFGEDFAAAIPPEQMEVMRQRFYDRYVGARHCLIRLTEAQDPFFAALDANLSGYRAVACPTLIVAAELDGFIPIARTRALAEGIRGARFVIIEGAGHAVVVERPQRLAALCLELIEGLAS